MLVTWKSRMRLRTVRYCPNHAHTGRTRSHTRAAKSGTSQCVFSGACTVLLAEVEILPPQAPHLEPHLELRLFVERRRICLTLEHHLRRRTTRRRTPIEATVECIGLRTRLQTTRFPPDLIESLQKSAAAAQYPSCRFLSRPCCRMPS